jgi:hypothetical protein
MLLPVCLMYLGEAYILADRLEDALALVGRALPLARECGQRGYEAPSLRLLGEIAARRDPPEQADGHYRDALALAEKLGFRPLIAHCHLSLGKLYRRTGAREHIATATTMYREMNMPFWLEQAEVENTVSAATGSIAIDAGLILPWCQHLGETGKAIRFSLRSPRSRLRRVRVVSRRGLVIGDWPGPRQRRRRRRKSPDSKICGRIGGRLRA